MKCLRIFRQNLIKCLLTVCTKARYIYYISLSNKHGFRVGRYGPIAPSDIYCRKFNNLSEIFWLGRGKENAPVKYSKSSHQKGKLSEKTWKTTVFSSVLIKVDFSDYFSFLLSTVCVQYLETRSVSELFNVFLKSG